MATNLAWLIRRLQPSDDAEGRSEGARRLRAADRCSTRAMRGAGRGPLALRLLLRDECGIPDGEDPLAPRETIEEIVSGIFEMGEMGSSLP